MKQVNTTTNVSLDSYRSEELEQNNKIRYIDQLVKAKNETNRMKMEIIKQGSLYNGPKQVKIHQKIMSFETLGGLPSVRKLN